METKDYDANDRIAGFSILAIKRALVQVGLLDDRDDIDSVARSLSCPASQAERVLEELEKRGLVKKTTGRRHQWDTTTEGRKLAYHWHPPRKYLPAIDWEDTSNTLEHFASIRCGLWRTTEDEEEEFEEAELSVKIHDAYDHDRLIEIDIEKPDEYGEECGGGVCDRCIYISPKDARTFMAGLEKAIARAEKELEHRVVIKERREKRDEEKCRARYAKRASTLAAASSTPKKEPRLPPNAEQSDAALGPNRIAESLAAVRTSNRAKRGKQRVE